jgi:hypothetical protein
MDCAHAGRMGAAKFYSISFAGKKISFIIIAIEKEINLGELKKRCDIVVYKTHQPWMIIECKEQAVQLNNAVIEQVLRYNISLKVAFLVVTNGESTYAIEITTTTLLL